MPFVPPNPTGSTASNPKYISGLFITVLSNESTLKVPFVDIPTLSSDINNIESVLALNNNLSEFITTCWPSYTLGGIKLITILYTKLSHVPWSLGTFENIPAPGEYSQCHLSFATVLINPYLCILATIHFQVFVGLG